MDLEDHPLVEARLAVLEVADLEVLQAEIPHLVDSEVVALVPVLLAAVHLEVLEEVDLVPRLEEVHQVDLEVVALVQVLLAAVRLEGLEEADLEVLQVEIHLEGSEEVVALVPVLPEGLEAVDLKVPREEILHQADLEAVALVQVQQGEALVQEEQLVGGVF